MQTSVSRRQFLATASAGAGAFAIGTAWSHEPDAGRIHDSDVAFFLISDTHVLARKDEPTRIDDRSIATCRGLINTLNALPGTKIPEHAGGGVVSTPRGVIHAGDLIDSADKQGGPHPQMIETEWSTFVEECGLSGTEGRLKFPIYEVHGNHDGPGGESHPVRQIIARNKSRPGLKNVSENGLHYAWDWGPVHFVNLGIVVGSDPALNRAGRYNPLGSLGFLKSDLERNVGVSGRPVVITHHVDVARYSKPCDEQSPLSGVEWDSCDVRAFYRTIKSFNVMAVLYGHTHVRNVFRWDGTPQKAENGVPVFNVDNGSHFSSNEQAFFYFHLHGDSLTVREVQTKDRWQNFSWTTQTWTQPVSLPKA
jgi:predicted phosphodiesterase